MVTLTRGALGSRVCCTAAGNGIGEAGATAIAAALEKNTTITSVDLGGARECGLEAGGGWMGIGGAWTRSRGRRAGARCGGERGDASALRVRARSV